MQDKEFMNEYQEILFENFSSVIKQNILFQTQLKQSEKKEKTIEELNTKIHALESSVPQGVDVQALQQNYDNLQVRYNNLLSEKDTLRTENKKILQEKIFLEKENVSIKEKNKDNNKILSEKNQIETSFKKTINDLLLEKEKLNSKVSELEKNISVYKTMIAPSKLRGMFKKIEKEEKTKVDSG